MLRANLLYRGCDSPVKHAISTGELGIYRAAPCGKKARPRPDFWSNSLILLGVTISKSFSNLLYGTWLLGILLQRGITVFDREAAALPGRFLPELGRSPERPFF